MAATSSVLLLSFPHYPSLLLHLYLIVSLSASYNLTSQRPLGQFSHFYACFDMFKHRWRHFAMSGMQRFMVHIRMFAHILYGHLCIYIHMYMRSIYVHTHIQGSDSSACRWRDILSAAGWLLFPFPSPHFTFRICLTVKWTASTSLPASRRLDNNFNRPFNF